MDVLLPGGRFRFIGGRLCLDFVNTRGWRPRNPPYELLTSYEAWVKWSQFAGIVSDSQAGMLFEEMDWQPELASQTLVQAIALRDTIYCIFASLVQEYAPRSSDLELLSQAYAQSQSHVWLRTTDSGYALDWQRKDLLDSPLWPVTRSAVELLTSQEIKLVRVCPGEDCGWLFLDESRNHTRRWCAPDICGNKTRVREHYYRHHPQQHRQGYP